MKNMILVGALGIFLISSSAVDTQQIQNLSQKEHAALLVYEPGYNQSTVIKNGQPHLIYPQQGTLKTLGFSWSSDVLHYALPSLSPDGNQVAFVRRLSANSSSETVTIYDFQQRTYQDLCTVSKGIYFLAWSPLGNSIAFISEKNQNQPLGFRLNLLDIKSQQVTELLPATVLGANGFFSWSPNGKEIVFEQDVLQETKSDKLKQLIILNLEKKDLRILGYGCQPAWSPDGQFIAFLEPKGKTCYLIHPDGSNKQKLFSYKEILPFGFEMIGPLIWSPESQYLIYHRTDGTKGDRRKVFSFNLRTRKKQELCSGSALQITGWVMSNQK